MSDVAADVGRLARNGAGSAGVRQVTFLVPDMHCAGCIRTLERTMQENPAVSAARANLTSRQLAVSFDPSRAGTEGLVSALKQAGFEARPVDADIFAEKGRSAGDKALIRALAVAGFAAANIMLLSVSVWAGADGSTRALFHWLSALIALPAIAYAGQPFFRSAWRALSAKRLNMDVPISLAVVLAAGMSLYQTMIGAEHAWFDASVALLFFLLAGRVLDARMRGLTRAAATRLLALAPDDAHVVDADGTTHQRSARDIQPGAVIRVLPGQQVPLDGVVLSGASDIDRSALTGETLPEPAEAGSEVHAGTLNLTGLLDVRVTRAAGDTLLADIVRLMHNAETGRGAYVALADKAAAIYAPMVHIVAALSFAGWLLAGVGIYDAATIAIAVLIITCPCALGLAAPAAQVAASGALMKRGIILKDGAALERLAAVDKAIFDKTGTLTSGRPVLAGPPAASDEDWSLALGLAQASRHPLAVALAGEARRRGVQAFQISDVREEPGHGICGRWRNETVRLGRRAWAAPERADTDTDGASHIWLGAGVKPAVCFAFTDELKLDAAEVVKSLSARGVTSMLLSGDRRQVVSAAARQTGIADWRGEMTPDGKIAEIRRLQAHGHRVLMVGDGINDAPALAAADVSMAPANGSDITQSSADIILTGGQLAPVLDALRAARSTKRVILQNFALAALYNLGAVPLAIAGFATPLLAALAMSTSSLLVTANALRLAHLLRRREHAPREREAALREAVA